MNDSIGVGRGLVVWSWAGTAVFAITAVAATIDLDLFGPLAVAVALFLFGIGLAAMSWAFGIAVARSRFDAIGIGGLFFGAGSAPTPVRRHLLGSLVAEVIIGVTTASIRVFTTLAFGTLVPVFALGLSGLWCARHGSFEPTDPPSAIE